MKSPRSGWTAGTSCPNFSHVAKSKTKSAAAEPADTLSFENALKKLESIVEQMESDELPLEDLLKRFEEGTQLASACQKKLAEADLKIQQLEKNASGEFKLQSVEFADDNPDDDAL